MRDDLKYIFEVNLNSRIDVKISNNHKIIFIDNFYKRPHLVREFLLMTPSLDRKNLLTNSNTHLIGKRSIIKPAEFSSCWDEIYHIILKEFNMSKDDLEYEDSFVSNIYAQYNLTETELEDMQTPLIKNNLNPHLDSAISATLWLNTYDECKGGTAFYKNTKYNSIDIFDIKDYSNYSKIRDEYANGINDDWEMIEILPMKYNRLSIYHAARFHNPYIEDMWFKDYYRISQQFFFNIERDRLYKTFKRWK